MRRAVAGEFALGSWECINRRVTQRWETGKRFGAAQVNAVHGEVWAAAISKARPPPGEMVAQAGVVGHFVNSRVVRNHKPVGEMKVT